jgi:hypothetical protein
MMHGLKIPKRVTPTVRFAFHMLGGIGSGLATHVTDAFISSEHCVLSVSPVFRLSVSPVTKLECFPVGLAIT